MNAWNRPVAGAMSERRSLALLWVLCFAAALVSAQDLDNVDRVEAFDTMIVEGWVYDGSGRPPSSPAVGIRGDRIAFIGDPRSITWSANTVIDAGGHLVAPGFIDPHTHSLGDLQARERRLNLNYLTQGVTTVFVGNDGGGSPHIRALAQRLQAQGIGTNVAFFVGHGAVRTEVMGRENRSPTRRELERMKVLVSTGMKEGALGLSTGLYYTPGNYATTDEVVALAAVVAPYGGLYETHLRDESSYQMGFLAALREALEIGERAGIPVHIGHIKALGVDVWGDSKAAVQMIEAAQTSGLRVTADQYPWAASGTYLRNALMPGWALADSDARYQERLRDAAQRDKLLMAVKDNIRRRGGGEALLIATCPDARFRGKTLADAADVLGLDEARAALEILRLGRSRVISFNMSDEDIEHFMRQPWVMTSSDGNERHPRKYASFPRKYASYVEDLGLMDVATFIHRSSGLTARTFGLEKRGLIRVGHHADIVIIDPRTYRPQADYLAWNRLSTGVRDVFVNGRGVIRDGAVVPAEFPGRVLRRSADAR